MLNLIWVGWGDRQPRIAARMILGVKTAIRALRSVEGMDKLGPAYLMARERAAERVNTLRMGLMLVFIEVVVGWAIGCESIIASMCCEWACSLDVRWGRSLFPGDARVRYLYILE
ncbi:hypothetical protein [Microcoleus sp. F4-D5]|uniref:hypothetical protein n=1 Tax=Microcoleus sp. F4-D5 TaxID=2818760 RepID=UPI002FCF17AC